jgi:hypothetical protein
MNYRSVVVFGTAAVVEDETTKREALRAFTEHIAPQRWREVRSPTESELKATTVLAIPLEEVSAKVRTGPPLDDEDDYSLPVWAGVLPLKLRPEQPVADSRVSASIEVPDYVRHYDRHR